MARKEFVFGEVKMRRIAAANQESIVLIESEFAPSIGPFQDSKSNAHRGSITC